MFVHRNLRHSLSPIAITFDRMRKKDSFLSLQFYETGIRQGEQNHYNPPRQYLS